MPGSKHPFIAREGWPFILAAILAFILLWRYVGVLAAIPMVLATVWLVLLFRDPHRAVPSAPLAVLSPVDGRIVAVEPTDRGRLDREAIRITIAVNHMGTYTARSPVEGKLLDLHDNLAGGSRLRGGGLWLRTDEGDDVVVLMRGPGFIARPVTFLGYGERLGHGQRCASLRLTRYADVYVAANSRIDVAVGDRVRAGLDRIATLVHK